MPYPRARCPQSQVRFSNGANQPRDAVRNARALVLVRVRVRVRSSCVCRWRIARATVAAPPQRSLRTNSSSPCANSGTVEDAAGRGGARAGGLTSDRGSATTATRKRTRWNVVAHKAPACGVSEACIGDLAKDTQRTCSLVGFRITAIALVLPQTGFGLHLCFDPKEARRSLCCPWKSVGSGAMVVHANHTMCTRRS